MLHNAIVTFDLDSTLEVWEDIMLLQVLQEMLAQNMLNSLQVVQMRDSGRSMKLWSKLILHLTLYGALYTIVYNDNNYCSR